MEIERKYLVRTMPADLDQHPHVEVEQAYLCTAPTVRVRRMGEEYILTVKQHLRVDSTAIHNREEEFLLPVESYRHLLSKCDGTIVSKTRYRIPLPGGLTAELDLFHGRHEGLRLVEVEFPGTQAANAFIPPDWFGDDVSSDPRYRNAYLSNPLNPTPIA